MPVSLYYISKRTIFGFLVILGIIIISYIFVYFAPGDPAYVWAGRPRGPKAEQAVQEARKFLGLDKPLYMQVARYVYSIFVGKLGVSIKYKIPISVILLRGLTSTLELLTFTYIVSIPLGVFLGIEVALRRRSILDDIFQIISLVLANMPVFWIGMLLFASLTNLGLSSFGRVDVYLALNTGFRPLTGFYLLDSLLEGNILVFLDILWRLIPPSLAIMLYPIGLTSRITRALISEKFHEDYIKTAVSWGLPRKLIVWRYAFRGVIPPLIQVTGLNFAYSLIDAMVIEIVFGREGLGKIIYDAIPASDFPLLIGVMIIVAIMYVLANTIAYIVQAVIDPRVKL